MLCQPNLFAFSNGEDGEGGNRPYGETVMKKMALLGILALTIAVLGEQKASAWTNFKFGVGLNWQWQSGGNNLLWGAAHGSQPPGAEQFGEFYPGHFHGHDPMFFGSAAPILTSPEPQAYAPAQSLPYQSVNYGYYTAPAYYYPAIMYGR